MTEDEKVGWPHGLSGHRFEQTLKGRRSLVCCSPWGHKDWIAFSDKTAIIHCPGKTMGFEVERSKCLKGVDPSLGHLRGSGALRGSESTPQPSAHVLLTWWREG